MSEDTTGTTPFSETPTSTDPTNETGTVKELISVEAIGIEQILASDQSEAALVVNLRLANDMRVLSFSITGSQDVDQLIGDLTHHRGAVYGIPGQ